MEARVLTMWFFIVFIPLIYVVFQLLMAFDVEKILRRNKIRELKMLMILISIGLSFLVASAFIEVLERISVFFV